MVVFVLNHFHPCKNSFENYEHGFLIRYARRARIELHVQCAAATASEPHEFHVGVPDPDAGTELLPIVFSLSVHTGAQI